MQHLMHVKHMKHGKHREHSKDMKHENTYEVYLAFEACDTYEDCLKRGHVNMKVAKTEAHL